MEKNVAGEQGLRQSFRRFMGYFYNLHKSARTPCMRSTMALLLFMFFTITLKVYGRI